MGPRIHHLRRVFWFSLLVLGGIVPAPASAGIEVGACCVNRVCQDNAGQGIDRGTCEQTLRGFFYGDGSSCQAANCDVPTVSQWGVLILALSVLTAGTVVSGRRRTTRFELKGLVSPSPSLANARPRSLTQRKAGQG